MGLKILAECQCNRYTGLFDWIVIKTEGRQLRVRDRIWFYESGGESVGHDSDATKSDETAPNLIVLILILMLIALSLTLVIKSLAEDYNELVVTARTVVDEVPLCPSVDELARLLEPGED